MNAVIRILLFLSFTTFISIPVYTQDLALSHTIKLKSGLTDNREAYPIINEATGQVCLVLMDKSSVTAMLLDKDMQVEKEITFPIPTGPSSLNKMSNPIGNFHSGDSFFLVGEKGYKSDKHFEFLQIDFEKEQMTFHERWKMTIDPGEIILSTFSQHGKFYTITVFKKFPTLRVYELAKIGGPKISSIELPADIALSNKHKDLVKYLQKEVSSFEEIPQDASAASLAVTSKLHKLYVRENDWILSIDKVGGATHLLNINLENNRCDYAKIDYPKTRCVASTDTSIPASDGNSFLYEDRLFQLNICSSEAQIKISDLNSKEAIKTYHFSGRDSIAFKNGAISFKKERSNKDDRETELKNSAVLLSKMQEYNVAIAARKNDQAQLEMIVGAYYLYVPSSGGAPVFMPGVPGISTPYGNVPGTAGSWRFNPTYGSVKSTGLARIVSFKSILNQDNLEHLQGDVSPHMYDRLQEKLEIDFDEKIFRAETVFWFNNAFYFGVYNKDNEQYTLYRYSK